MTTYTRPQTEGTSQFLGACSLVAAAIGLVSLGFIGAANGSRHNYEAARAFVAKAPVIRAPYFNPALGIRSLYEQERITAEQQRPDLDWSCSGGAMETVIMDTLRALNKDHVDSTGLVLPGHERRLVKKDLDLSGD